MNLELCVFLTSHALAVYLPMYSGNHLGKDFGYLVFLFSILVVLLKPVYLHPRSWLGQYEQLVSWGFLVLLGFGFFKSVSLYVVFLSGS